MQVLSARESRGLSTEGPCGLGSKIKPIVFTIFRLVFSCNERHCTARIGATVRSYSLFWKELCH
jgi:hypothetical protein